MRTNTALTAAALLLLVSLAWPAAADRTGAPQVDQKWERMAEEERRALAEEERRALAEWKANEGKNYRERSEEDTRQVFAEWKARHGKKYGSASEEERRYGIFKDHLLKVDLHDAAIHAGYREVRALDINGFSDITQEEWNAINWGFRPSQDVV